MKKRFSVPENTVIVAKEVVCAIIASIPPGWTVLRGSLRAPKGMLDSGEALAHTELVFASSINKMIRRTDNLDKDTDVFGILIEGKKPESVEFGTLFGYCEVMSMKQSKRMAVHFIQLGYRGRLTFRWRDPDDDRDPARFECEIWMPPHQERVAPTITVISNSEDYPHDGTIAPIVAFCEQLMLPVVDC